MTQAIIYLGIIGIVWIITNRYNDKFDDDPFKDFLRSSWAVFLTLLVLFFWNWI